MAKLILIDHSLHRPGGHHFDYAFQVLRAAEQAGYQVITAVNRRFACNDRLPEHWRVVPLFRHHTYNEYSVLSGKSQYPCNPFVAPTDESAEAVHSIAQALRGLPARVRQILRKRDQRQRALRFARSCEQLFRSITLEPRDQVFLPTMSDFDLVGLSLFLRSFSLRARTNWHAQFHFNFLEGSKAKYSSQTARVDRMSQHFRQLLQGLDDVPLHFYATTPELVAQYNLLRATRFRLLNYPVNPSFLGGEERRFEQPLRVLCAGGLREEKGSHELAKLVEEMKDRGLAGGKLQFWVQAKRPSRVAIAAEDRYVLTGMDQRPPDSARVVCVPHPLEPEDYLRLLRSAHVGLFLYDADRYFARCSGILVELLTAGVPVIVPGGCWLGEQLRHPGASGAGLVANDRREVPHLLAQMWQRYEYHAQSARAFAPRYFDMHRPADVIATLERSSLAQRRDHAA